MKKSGSIFITTIKEYFAYRFNFLIWRLRVMIGFLIPLFLWSSITSQVKNFNGYNEKTIVNYFIYTYFISFFILGTRTVDIAGQIQNGEIINLILKPISFFKYYLFRDLADKFLNFLCSAFELFFLITVFKLPFSLPNLENLSLFLFFLLIGFFISFFISLAISFIGFYSNEVWAPRFVFMVLIQILSGIYFPLDILPKPLFNFLFFTPFPYYFFIPVKIITQPEILFLKINLYFSLLISLLWVLLSFLLAKILWQKGNKSFSFWGR